jgi:hypothetical protein
MVRELAQGYGMSFSARTLQDSAGGGSGLGAYLFPNGSYYGYATPGLATVTWSAMNTGEIEIIEGYAPITSYTWLTGGGTNVDYEIRWTIISTTPTTGVTGTWINMSVGPSWSMQANLTIRTCQGFVEIRQVAAPNTVLASANVTLTAESEP